MKRTVIAACVLFLSLPASMANGQDVSISVDDGVMINDANVIVVDIPARNGVIHLIDGVLLP